VRADEKLTAFLELQKAIYAFAVPGCKTSPLLELALVLVRLDHIVSVIELFQLGHRQKDACARSVSAGDERRARHPDC